MKTIIRRLIDWETFETKRSKLNFSDIFAEYLAKWDIIFKTMSVPFEMASRAIFNSQRACHSILRQFTMCVILRFYSLQNIGIIIFMLFLSIWEGASLLLSTLLSLLLKNSEEKRKSQMKYFKSLSIDSSTCRKIVARFLKVKDR